MIIMEANRTWKWNLKRGEQGLDTLHTIYFLIQFTIRDNSRHRIGGDKDDFVLF